MNYDVVIIGAGPAGLFAAYELIEKNKKLKVCVLDRGNSVKTRVCPMAKKGVPCQNCNPCNILSGYGGAGTFSDGKLTTNVNSELNRVVLETFVKFGAPEEILYTTKAHIGTDNLRKVIKNMREEILRLGGIVNFNSKVSNIKFSEEKVRKKRKNE